MTQHSFEEKVKNAWNALTAATAPVLRLPRQHPFLTAASLAVILNSSPAPAALPKTPAPQQRTVNVVAPSAPREAYPRNINNSKNVASPTPITLQQPAANVVAPGGVYSWNINKDVRDAYRQVTGHQLPSLPSNWQLELVKNDDGQYKLLFTNPREGIVNYSLKESLTPQQVERLKQLLDVETVREPTRHETMVQGRTEMNYNAALQRAHEKKTPQAVKKHIDEHMYAVFDLSALLAPGGLFAVDPITEVVDTRFVYDFSTFFQPENPNQTLGFQVKPGADGFEHYKQLVMNSKTMSLRDKLNVVRNLQELAAQFTPDEKNPSPEQASYLEGALSDHIITPEELSDPRLGNKKLYEVIIYSKDQKGRITASLPLLVYINVDSSQQVPEEAPLLPVIDDGIGMIPDQTPEQPPRPKPPVKKKHVSQKKGGLYFRMGASMLPDKEFSFVNDDPSFMTKGSKQAMIGPSLAIGYEFGNGF